MDTLGPVSVLDSGRRNRDVIITDRITRRRSPDRPRLKAAHSEQDVVYRIPQPYRTSFSARQSVERIPATDRSRSLSPTSSLRSTQSCRSERTWRGRHNRAKSPKRVTYDTRVTVRHSDTDDSIFTELSSHDLESSLCHTQKPNSTFSTSNQSEVSKDSGIDYSVQLKDLSDQIIKMDWSRKQPDELHGSRASSGISSSSILKDSQNSRKLQSPNLISAVNQSLVSTHAPPSQSGDKENTPNGSPQPYSAESGAAYRTPLLSPDYQPDRSYSYRQAISDHYSSDVRALVDAGIEEKGPCVLSGPETGGLQQRSNSVTAVSKASSPTSSQLTPSKRSVSTSISNFFRRISPHLGRKRGKDRGASPTTASSQSLPAATGHQVEPATPSPTSQSPAIPAASNSSSGHFSHNKIRSSFLKLMGKPSKESKSKKTSSHCSHAENVQGLESVSPASCGETPGKTDERDTKQPQQMPESAQRVLKSIEKSNLSNKNIYREFKDKRSPHGSATAAGADSDLEERYRAIKAQYKDRPLSYQDETAALLDDIAAPPPSRHPLTRSSAFNHSDKCDSYQYQKDSLTPEEGASLDADESGNIANKSRESNNRGGKVAPPSSLDVVPPRAIRLLQASTISTISGDESIGECSLDCNLTASEPSLLSGNSQSAGSCLSKKAVLNQSLISSTEGHLPSDNTPETSINTADTASCVPQRRQKDALILGQELLDSVSKLAEKDYASPVSPLSPPSATESAHKPSYLKLSCAVSGYGKYSRYSSYKSIPTRSPFSSTSSLRSDLSSPDPIMPSLRSPDTCGDLRVQSAGVVTSPSCAGEMAQTLKSEPYDLTPSYNGHLPIPTIQLTGDPVKDGEYFVNLANLEEQRLKHQAQNAEGMMRAQDLPEEVNGKIRAAIGKSNLLISQKFQQFHELCSQHMHPEPEERVPLLEDLQGFWDMIKIQIDNVDDMFAEIQHMSQNDWKEVPKQASRRSSASSSPKSAGSLSQASTPSATPGHTPGSKRRGLKGNSKDTPESSPERTQKARSAAKARDEARKKMLAEKRAAMKQQQQQLQQQQEGAADVEIFLADSRKQ